MSYRNHAEEIQAALRGEHERQQVALLEPQGHDDPLGTLYRDTTPKPGCPGVRVDAQGREWYSAGWVSLRSGLAPVDQEGRRL